MKKTLSRLPRVVRLAVLSAVLLALCSKSSPLYAFNDWMDANIFFTMGRSMLGGRVLYRDVFDHKGPVLYLLYGLAGLVGGTDFRGVLVLEIIAMTWFLYTGLRTAELLAGRRLSVWWMALPAAGLAASRATATRVPCMPCSTPMSGCCALSACPTTTALLPPPFAPQAPCPITLPNACRLAGEACQPLPGHRAFAKPQGVWGRGTAHSPRMQYAVTTPDRGYPLAMRLPR